MVPPRAGARTSDRRAGGGRLRGFAGLGPSPRFPPTVDRGHTAVAARGTQAPAAPAWGAADVSSGPQPDVLPETPVKRGKKAGSSRLRRPLTGARRTRGTWPCRLPGYSRGACGGRETNDSPINWCDLRERRNIAAGKTLPKIGSRRRRYRENPTLLTHGMDSAFHVSAYPFYLDMRYDR